MMRPRTAGALVVVLLVLAGLVVVALGGSVVSTDSGTSLSHEWTSDTGREVQGNHHAVAAGRVGGSSLVFAPISGRGDTTACALVALDSESETKRWTYRIPPSKCAIHSVADPTLADYDGDGTTEVVTATTEEAVIAFDAESREEELRVNLTTYGYTQPIVADIVGDAGQEIIAVDVGGTVVVAHANGTVAWTRQLDAYTWGQPAVADFDGDGSDELVVGVAGGNVTLFEANGSTGWTLSSPFQSSVTWMTTGQADDDPPIEVVVATVDGVVAMIDGGGGEPTIQWRQEFGNYAAVHAFGDGDGDGTPEVYAVAKDGTLRSLDARDGTVEWSTTLTTADVQMTPPPSLGDVDGDGQPELVAVTNDGVVSLVDPATGEVLDSYEREITIYARPTLADVDGDGALEVFVIYGDGRVVAFSAS